MNLEISAVDLLSDDQKNDLGCLVFKKISDTIKASKIRPIEIDINDQLSSTISDVIDTNLYEWIDTEAIGTTLTKNILSTIGKGITK